MRTAATRSAVAAHRVSAVEQRRRVDLLRHAGAVIAAGLPRHLRAANARRALRGGDRRTSGLTRTAQQREKESDTQRRVGNESQSRRALYVRDRIAGMKRREVRIDGDHDRAVVCMTGRGNHCE